MRRTKRLTKNTITAILLLVVSAAQIRAVGVVAADSANAPSLVISQFKITSSNGQFITLYNTTDTTLDMSKYQLEYFNSYDLSKATSSKLISLTGTVPPHGYFRVNDDSLLLCYRQTVDSVSLGVSSTAGLIEVLAYNQAMPGNSVTPVLQDFVGWSKSAAAGAQTLPSNTSAFLERLPADANNNPVVVAPGSGNWQAVQPAANDPCNLVVTNTNAAIPIGNSQLLPSLEPAATVIRQVDTGGSTTAVSLPASDAGLMAPVITEILPNPAGTGNDATDEFIEIYNPNPTSFDLSGFVLQSGTSSTHKFTFPSSTSLPPQSFTAFYATTTGLSLSNSGGQVKLLDPSGNQLFATDAYSSAADGQAWALANGKWYWTTKPTPSAPNVIVEPTSKSPAKASAKQVSKKSATAVKAKAANLQKPKKPKTTLASASAATPPTTPIHTSMLVVVAGLALLYGAYEYRNDLANYYHRLKRHFKPGPSSG